MFKWFLNLFFYKKECYSLEKRSDKIKCVKEHLVFNPYFKEFRDIKIVFINKTIEGTVIELRQLKYKIENNSTDFNNITENTVSSLQLKNWFSTTNGKILSNHQNLWHEYLDLSIWLSDFYDKHINDEGGIDRWVSLKIKPYIINIDIVVNTLIDSQKKEL